MNPTRRLPVERLLEARLHGLAAWVPTLVAVAAGVVFVSTGIGHLIDHDSEVADFRRYEVPLASIAVWGVGVVELAGSLLFLAIGCVAALWLASRIYRVGLLMYGKRPTMREMARWVSYAR